MNFSTTKFPKVLIAMPLLLALTACDSDMSSGELNAEPAPASTHPTDTESPADSPISRSTNASVYGCVEVLTVVFRPLQVLEVLLPMPWQPRDAGSLFDLPELTGLGAVFMMSLTCESGAANDGAAFSQGELSIVVEPPEFSGIDHIGIHQYAIETYMGEQPMVDVLDAVGWPVLRGEITNTAAGDPLNALWTSSISVAGANQWLAENAGVVPAIEENTPGRVWNVTEQGTGYFEFTYPVTLEGNLGLATCTLGAGTAAEGVAAEGCQTPTAVVFPETSWDSNFVFLDGVFPTMSDETPLN